MSALCRFGLLALAAVAAGTALPAAAATGDDALAGTWRVAAIGGEAVPADAGLAVVFSAGEFSGETGCNHFSGRYSVTGSGVAVGPIRTTKRACRGEPGTREARLLRAVGTAIRFETTAEGVVLHGASGELLVLSRG